MLCGCIVNSLALYASGYGASILSALIPIINAELLLLSLTALVSTKADVFAMAVIVTCGQATGTMVLYFLANKSTHWHPPRRMAAAIERWRERFESAPRGVAGLVFASSCGGVPPYSVTTILAGTLGIDFKRFILIASTGRFIRFTIVAFFPQVVYEIWNLL